MVLHKSKRLRTFAKSRALRAPLFFPRKSPYRYKSMVLKPSEKPPEDKKRSFVLRDRDSSHLTILHTALIMAGIVFMLVAIYVFRPYIPLAVSNFIKQQIFISPSKIFVDNDLLENVKQEK